MNLNDPLHEGKPSACPLRFWVELVEQTEHAVEVFGGNAYPMIPNIEDSTAMLCTLTTAADPITVYKRL